MVYNLIKDSTVSKEMIFGKGLFRESVSGASAVFIFGVQVAF